MLNRLLAACFLMCFAAAGVAAPQGHGGLSLEGALDHLDAQSRGFHSLSADVERTKVTVVVNDRSTETGTILVHGEHMRMDLKNPDARTILRTGDSLYIFNPKENRVEEYNLGKYKAFADQYLLLGFGTPGHELKKGYLVTLRGEPTLDGKKTCELELTPKSEAVRNQISKIQLWFDEGSWLPVQQQFFETGSDDYFVIRYSNMVRNAQIDENEFKPHWPKGAKVIKPQGGE